MDIIDYSLLGSAFIVGLFFSWYRKSKRGVLAAFLVIAETFTSYYWYDLVVFNDYPSFIDTTVQIAIYAFVMFCCVVIGNFVIALAYFTSIVYFTVCFFADAACYAGDSCQWSDYLADNALYFSYGLAWFLIILGLVNGDDGGRWFRNRWMSCRNNYNLLHIRFTRVLQRIKKSRDKMV